MTPNTIQMPCARVTRAVFATVLSGLLSTLAWGQGAQTPEQTRSTADQADTQDAELMQELVVTGTAIARTGFDTPLSVTRFDESELLKLRSSSQADILATVPGLKAEGGGGELASNVQVRALPSAGQYQYTPLEYNGVPVFSTFGLNSSAFDVYARDDLGVERLEYVTGGVSNLFGPGSVAGIINYIDKTGSDTPEGIIQTEFSDEGRFRGDFFSSGPVGGADADTYYAVSGFYRYDEGPLDTDLVSDGFQVRGNLRRELENGSFTLYAQVIDDRTQFFLPVPLDPLDKERVNGNDGEDVLSLNTNAIDGMRVLLNDGFITLDHVSDGVTTSGAALYGVLDRELGSAWRLSVKAKYADYEHRFGIFDPTDGLVNVPETLTQFIANRAAAADGDLDARGTPVFTFAESGVTVPADALIVASRHTDRYRPATDFSTEISMTRRFDASFSNDLTVGAFIARTEASDVTRTVRYLTDFNNSPDLVNLRFVDGTGATTATYALNGFTGAVAYGNSKNAALRTAFYAANQMQGERWAFDVGARVERLDGDLRREPSRNILLDAASYTAQTGATGPLPNLLTVSNGGGVFRHAEVDTTGWDLSVGGLYKVTDSINVYANASRGFFFPGLNSVAFNALGQAQEIEPEDVVLAEVGMKFATGSFVGSVAGFYMTDDNRRQALFINGPGGSIIETANIIASKGYGVEINGRYRIAGAFWADANVMLQDHEYTEYDVTPAFVGNELLRKPKVFANAGFTYDNGAFSASIFDNYQGAAFANDSQLDTVKLDAYHLVRLNLGYSMELAGARELQFGLDVFNLLDSQGLAEGNPRAFNAQTGTEAYFVGRPILPRRYTARMTLTF